MNLGSFLAALALGFVAGAIARVAPGFACTFWVRGDRRRQGNRGWGAERLSVAGST
jgi:hypothetical protein